MKSLLKITVSLTAALLTCLCLGINSFAAKIYFEDNAGLYSDEQEKELMNEQQELCDYTGWNIAVITTDIDFPTDGYDAIEYAESRYKALFGSYDADGILFLIDLGYRHFAIGGEPDLYYFNDYRVNKMLDRCEDKYYDYDDMGNIREYFNCVREFYDAGPFTHEDNYSSEVGYYNDSGVPISELLLIICVSGLIAAGIGIAVVLSRYKFHAKTNAACYIRSGGVDMYESSDIFIRETVTKTKNESSNSSGGGGSHHGSSGGHSMGGGGRGGHR